MSLGYDDDLLYEQRLLSEGKKLHYRTKFQDLPISIENRRGSIRFKGLDWETKMKVPYGYIPGTKGVDGEALDVFTGPNENAAYAYIVHQNDPETGDFDEDKVMLGFNSAKQAKKVFLQHHDDSKFFGSMDTIPMWKFQKKIWVKKNTTTRLVASVRESQEGGPGSGPQGKKRDAVDVMSDHAAQIPKRVWIEKAGGIYRGSMDHPKGGKLHMFDDPKSPNPKATLTLHDDNIHSQHDVLDHMRAKRKEFQTKESRTREGKIYYARPLQVYESDREDRDLDFLESEFPGEELIVPRTCESGGDKDMSKYHREVDKADSVIFRPHRMRHGVHRVTAGVFSEAQHALHQGIPVRMLVRGRLHEVEGFKVRRPARADGDFADVILKRRRRR